MQDPGGLVRGVAGELALPPEVPVCEFWHHAASSSPKTTRRSKPMWKRTDPHRLLAQRMAQPATNPMATARDTRSNCSPTELV